MSHDSTMVAPASTFQDRLRAAFAVEIGPTILWGGLTILALVFVPPLIGWALYQADLYDGVFMRTTAPASTVGGGFIVLAIVGMAESGTGRRESVIGGWTRAQRHQLNVVFAAGFAVIGAVLWLVLALCQPLLESWLANAFAQSSTTIGFQTTVASPLAALVLAVSIFTAAFVPVMYVRLSHINWIAVVAGSIPVLVLLFVLGTTHLMFAEPTAELFAELDLSYSGWWLLASVLLPAAYVFWVWQLAKKAGIRRYGA